MSSLYLHLTHYTVTKGEGSRLSFKRTYTKNIRLRGSATKKKMGEEGGVLCDGKFVQQGK